MAEPRLKAGLWVKMALRMADLDGRSGVVLRKGDAGLGRRAGGAARPRWARGAVAGAHRRWRAGVDARTGAAPVDQAAADAYVARQVRFDPDIWVLEFDAPDLMPPFEAKLV